MTATGVTAFALALGLLPAGGVEIDKYNPIPTCEGRKLEPRVERLLRPVLLSLSEARRARREWDTAFETTFRRLLRLKDPDALEAKVALMAYYVGEHYGEELQNSFQPSTKADSLIKRYKICRPLVTFEERLSGIVVLRTLYDQYEEEQKQLASSAVVKDPDCTGVGSWAPSMAFVHLKNAGITDNDKLDFTKTKVVRLASEKIGNDLYRQLHRVTFTEKSGRIIEVITSNDASSQECSMSGVEVYVVSKRLGEHGDG